MLLILALLMLIGGKFFIDVIEMIVEEFINSITR